MSVDKNIELYQTSGLPKNGWIQACLACAAKTARLYNYKHIGKNKIIFDFKVYLCPDCKKNLSDQTFVTFLHDKCEKKINKLNIFNICDELYIPVKPSSPQLIASNSSTISI